MAVFTTGTTICEFTSSNNNLHIRHILRRWSVANRQGSRVTGYATIVSLPYFLITSKKRRGERKEKGGGGGKNLVDLWAKRKVERNEKFSLTLV